MQVKSQNIFVMAQLGYKGDWEDAKKRLKDKYPNLTEKDFEQEQNEEKLLHHLSQELGKTSDDMRRIIREI